MTPPEQGAWTFETLRAHLESLIAANDRRYEQRFADAQTAVNTALSAAEKAVNTAMLAAKEAVVKAETAAEKRFEGLNEFRAALSDQQRTLMPRTEAELRFSALEEKLNALTSGSVERRGTRAGIAQSWSLIVGGILFLLALFTFALKFLAP